MVIDSSGKVGIGIVSPLLKLHVEAGTIYANSAKSDTLLATNIAGTVTHNMIGSAGYWGIRTATNNSFNLDVYNGGSPKAALTVLNDGNVGIGTTSVGGKLHIYTGDSGGSVNSSVFGDSGGNSTGQIRYLHSDDSMRLTTANVERMIITSAGSVGIGTASPASKLHVYGADPVLTIQDSESTVANASAILRIGESDGTGGLNNNFAVKFVGTASGGDLDFSRYNNTTIASQGLRIKHDGNVGINTDNPTRKLDVRGNDTNAVFRASSTSGVDAETLELKFKGLEMVL
jgi:hypothetical protein